MSANPQVEEEELRRRKARPVSSSAVAGVPLARNAFAVLPCWSGPSRVRSRRYPPRRGAMVATSRTGIKSRANNGSEAARRYLRAHHRQDRRRSRQEPPALGSALERRQHRGRGFSASSPQRPTLRRHECLDARVGGDRPRLSICDLDDVPPGARARWPVRKGETGSMVVFASRFTKSDVDAAGEESNR